MFRTVEKFTTHKVSLVINLGQKDLRISDDS